MIYHITWCVVSTVSISWFAQANATKCFWCFMLLVWYDRSSWKIYAFQIVKVDTEFEECHESHRDKSTKRYDLFTKLDRKSSVTPSLHFPSSLSLPLFPNKNILIGWTKCVASFYQNLLNASCLMNLLKSLLFKWLKIVANR